MSGRLIRAMGWYFGLLLCWVPAVASDTVCFDCHDPAGFRGKRLHPAMREGGCQGCHAPHVSRNPGLLRQAEKELCFGCHIDLAARVERSQYVHAPIRSGGCGTCHAPHVAERPHLLRNRTLEVCLGCHPTLAEKKTFIHQPFADGDCSICHDPHAADDFRLLRSGQAPLCLGCHAGGSALQAKHLGYRLPGLDCLSCHNPHGSGNRKLIRQERHEPFAQGRCRACHGEQNSLTVCLGCHPQVLSSFNGIHSHLQGGGTGNPCTGCHNPHAGDRPGFFPENQGLVCRTCHADTFARRAASLHKHPVWNVCSECHTLHGSDRTGMLKAEPDAVCIRCHENHATFTHPIGEKAIDPRSREPMTCVSCHDANAGTLFKYNLRGGADRGLCIQCHRNY